ncbi:IS1595 family transposase [uncultured Shewanella sp.]|uniref:IS1595 family transposase n=1 Tax=uncultured Shewanella sp. TaxID=173975 RepID=UPI00260B0132|nr:IS1595 family transposase [uncultured Shewanella sp.]
MAKSKIQHQLGFSLLALFKHYGTEEQCVKALFNWKWTTGFICAECSSQSYRTLKSRKIHQCNRCHHQTSLTTNTIFEHSKPPLTIWFLSVHLIVQSKVGISALSLKRQIGVSYSTAWRVKQKIMQVMKERDDKRQLSGIVQVDDVYYGGECHGGKRGRGSENKLSFIAAISTKTHLSKGSTVVSDGLACFSAVKDAECEHFSIVTGGGPESVTKQQFIWVNTMIRNVKNAITGTYHSINPRHLSRYLAEYCYRFNRRCSLEDMLPRFMYVALRTPPMPQKYLSIAELYG